MAGGLWGEWFINMFVSELPPPLNVGAMLIVGALTSGSLPVEGKIAQAFCVKISRIFEVVTPTL